MIIDSYRYSVGGGTWTPADMSTVVFIEPSDAGSITTSGNDIVTLSDKSGNGYNYTVPTGSTAPQSGVNTIGGLNVITCNLGVLENSVPSNSFATDYNIVFLYQKFGANQTYEAGITRTVSNAGRPLDIYNAFRFIATNGISKTNLVTLTSPTIISIEVAQSGLSEYINGTKVGATSSVSGSYVDSATTTTIGSRADRITSSIAHFGEAVLYNTTSTENRQKIEGWMAHLRGLAVNLDPGHPYKSSPPTV